MGFKSTSNTEKLSKKMIKRPLQKSPRSPGRGINLLNISGFHSYRAKISVKEQETTKKINGNILLFSSFCGVSKKFISIVFQPYVDSNEFLKKFGFQSLIDTEPKFVEDFFPNMNLPNSNRTEPFKITEIVIQVSLIKKKDKKEITIEKTYHSKE